MSYTFRIRFARSPIDTIQIKQHVLTVPVSKPGVSVYLRAGQDNQPIKDSNSLLLLGEGYSSEGEAQRAGIDLQQALMIALARIRIGADFGERAANSIFTDEGLAWVEKQIGQRSLNDTHGLMVFYSEPPPKFMRFNADMVRAVRIDSFQKAFDSAIALHLELNDRDRLAFLLFNASFFQRAPDSRFLLLVMAVEALLDPAPRVGEAREHVDRLIAHTRSSSLSEDEKNSLIGSLRWFRYESISRAGRTLASARLGKKIYDSKSAPDFFTHCYRLRSNLVHGKFPIPTFEEIGAAAANLESFVSDILTCHLLGDVT